MASKIVSSPEAKAYEKAGDAMLRQYKKDGMLIDLLYAYRYYSISLNYVFVTRIAKKRKLVERITSKLRVC